MKDFLKNIGLIKMEEQERPFDYKLSDYNLKLSTDSEKIKTHKDFLKSVLDEENRRLGTIEGKTSQIISQTSIVFSLVGLIIPIVIQKSSETEIILKIVIIVLLLIAFGFYLLSISNALKNFNIKNFKYPFANPSNVIDFKDSSIEDFNSELVRDYLYCINQSIIINNTKATNLLHAHNTFRIANFITGIVVLVISVTILFLKPENQDIKIKNPIKIENLDSLLEKSKPIILIQNDTVRIKDTIYLKK